MVTVMNEYVQKITLFADDVTKGILDLALSEQAIITKHTIIMKSNKYIVDIVLDRFTIEDAIKVMNYFMEHTRFHYSAYFIRFNEGNRVRYRYATCKEDRSGFYCDVIIS